MAPYDPAFSPRSTTFRGVMLNSTSVPALSSYGLPTAPLPEPSPYGSADEVLVTGSRDLKTV